jgi:hypothetical protein
MIGKEYSIMWVSTRKRWRKRSRNIKNHDELKGKKKEWMKLRI